VFKGENPQGAHNVLIDKLYAVKKADYHNDDQAWLATHQAIEYIQIAEMDMKTGQITLVRNVPGNDWTGLTNDCTQNNALDMVLNGVGYGENNKYISQQFHAWVGYVANNGCDVAMFTFDNKDSKNHAIWAVSWERPINLDNDNVKKSGEDYEMIEDAQNNGAYIAIYDLLTFFDWRGKDKGLMEEGNKWLWSYYNIHRIDVDFNPANIVTTLNGGSLDNPASTLDKVSDMVRLYPATAAQHSALKSRRLTRFDTQIGWNGGNYASQNTNQALLNFLEGSQNGKANFGYIFYENNGLNVTTFEVRIPVIIYYEWGHFKTWVDVKIDTTQGH
jgi:hypothetical protein